jgi:hypothetical protein
MLDFLVCCVLVMKVKVREWDLLGKNTSVSSYHPPVSIQRRLNNESRKPFDYSDIAVKKVSNRGYVQPRRWFVFVAGGVAISKSPPPKGFIAIFLIMIIQRWRTIS